MRFSRVNCDLNDVEAIDIPVICFVENKQNNHKATTYNEWKQAKVFRRKKKKRKGIRKQLKSNLIRRT
jgi:hypothetical protein